MPDDAAAQCNRLAEAFCDWTEELRNLASQRALNAQRLSQRERELEDLGISRRELEDFINIPDTGNLLQEAFTRRRIVQARNNLIRILRRIRRNPLLAVDVTIGALKGEATRQANSLAAVERELLRFVRQLREDIHRIDERIDDIEDLMAEAGRRAEALGCDPQRTLRAC